MIKILFCRHGETLWNQQGRLQGHLDSPLSGAGIWQAQQLAAALERYQPKRIISSDLGRAISTAQLINQHLELPMQTSTLLRERNFGALQGKNKQEVKPLWRAYQQRFIADHLNIEGAESASEVLHRGLQFLTDISSLLATEVVPSDAPLVVICHGEWLRILQNAQLGLAPWSAQSPLAANCHITEYEYNYDAHDASISIA